MRSAGVEIVSRSAGIQAAACVTQSVVLNGMNTLPRRISQMAVSACLVCHAEIRTGGYSAASPATPKFTPSVCAVSSLVRLNIGKAIQISGAFPAAGNNELKSLTLAG